MLLSQLREHLSIYDPNSISDQDHYSRSSLHCTGPGGAARHDVEEQHKVNLGMHRWSVALIHTVMCPRRSVEAPWDQHQSVRMRAKHDGGWTYGLPRELSPSPCCVYCMLPSALLRHMPHVYMYFLDVCVLGRNGLTWGLPLLASLDCFHCLAEKLNAECVPIDWVWFNCNSP